MRYVILAVAVLLVLLAGVFVRGFFGRSVVAQTSKPAVSTKALTHTVKDIDGKAYDLGQLRGKVVLVVNVASKCGFTKQYAGLEALYKKYAERGLVIVGFPSNDFGGQEPGSDEDVKAFCSNTYGVTFPMMSKVKVKGDEKHPVYTDLTAGTGEFAGEVKWNFEKFIVARDGSTLVARFGSSVKPESGELVGAVEAALGQ